MLFSRIVCDATSIQGATDSVENFPLLDILEGGLKLLHLNLDLLDKARNNYYCT